MDARIWFITLISLLILLSWWIGATRRLGRKALGAISALIAISIVAGLVAFRVAISQYAICAVCFSVLVGAAEIISRYRDEPFAALLGNGFGTCYLVINGLIGLGAYGLLSRYGDTILPGIAKDALFRAILAGFGSSLIMRSKFFTLHTPSGEDLSFGPDAVISILLRSVDRGVDRARSARRQRIVFEACSKIKASNVAKAIPFMRTAIASFQNLSEAEKRDFDQIVVSLQREKPESPLTLMAIGFAFLNLSGESNFAALFEDLETYLRNKEIV